MLAAGTVVAVAVAVVAVVVDGDIVVLEVVGVCHHYSCRDLHYYRTAVVVLPYYCRHFHSYSGY